MNSISQWLVILGFPSLVGTLGYMMVAVIAMLRRKTENSKEELLRRFTKARKWLLIGWLGTWIGFIIQLVCSSNGRRGLINAVLMVSLRMLIPYGLLTFMALMIWYSTAHDVRHKGDPNKDKTDPNKDDSNLTS